MFVVPQGQSLSDKAKTPVLTPQAMAVMESNDEKLYLSINNKGGIFDIIPARGQSGDILSGSEVMIIAKNNGKNHSILKAAQGNDDTFRPFPRWMGEIGDIPAATDGNKIIKDKKIFFIDKISGGNDILKMGDIVYIRHQAQQFSKLMYMSIILSKVGRPLIIMVPKKENATQFKITQSLS